MTTQQTYEVQIAQVSTNGRLTFEVYAFDDEHAKYLSASLVAGNPDLKWVRTIESDTRRVVIDFASATTGCSKA